MKTIFGRMWLLGVFIAGCAVEQAERCQTEPGQYFHDFDRIEAWTCPDDWTIPYCYGSQAQPIAGGCDWTMAGHCTNGVQASYYFAEDGTGDVTYYDPGQQCRVSVGLRTE